MNAHNTYRCCYHFYLHHSLHFSRTAANSSEALPRALGRATRTWKRMLTYIGSSIHLHRLATNALPQYHTQVNMLTSTRTRLAALLLVTSTLAQLNNITTPALNITALDGINGSSVLQCWQLDPFAISTTPGTVGALSLNLGNVTSATYQIIPGRTNAGLHNAPVPQ